MTGNTQLFKGFGVYFTKYALSKYTVQPIFEMGVRYNPPAPFSKGDFKVPLNKGGIRGLLCTLHNQFTVILSSQFLSNSKPIEGEETFPRSESRTGFPRPWWEGLGEGVN